MTTWNWLPDNALAGPETLGVIDAALDDWSRRWFRSWRLARQRLQFAPAPTALPVVAATSWLTIRAGEPTRDILATHALDVDLTRLELTDADRTVTSGFRDRILQDLADTLGATLSSAGARAAVDMSGPVLIDLADDDGRKLMVIETSRAALAQLRWKTLKSVSGSRTPLASIRTAIGDFRVTVEARLGSSEVLMPDALKLAVGDVVVLDQQLDTPLVLAGPDGSAFACAHLVDTASPRSLRLEAVSGSRTQ